MKESRKGHIINIVSMAGLIATSKSSLYSATKFAAIGFSNALRLELMPYVVYVTTVNPGPIRTAFFLIRPTQMAATSSLLTAFLRTRCSG